MYICTDPVQKSAMFGTAVLYTSFRQMLNNESSRATLRSEGYDCEACTPCRPRSPFATLLSRILADETGGAAGACGLSLVHLGQSAPLKWLQNRSTYLRRYDCNLNDRGCFPGDASARDVKIAKLSQ